MKLLERVEVVAEDAGAPGEQRCEGLGPVAEGLGLLQQGVVTVEGLAIGVAQRHRVAIGTGPLAQLVPGSQHFLAASGEGVHRRTVAPGEGRALHLTGDPHERVVVRGRP